MIDRNSTEAPQPPQLGVPTPAGSSRAVVWLGLLLVALLMLGITGAFMLAQAEREKGVNSWQARLDLIADSRQTDASAWLNRHLATVEDLAGEPTLQLYAAEVALADDPALAEAQRSYAFNLLAAVADRSDFHEGRALDDVGANVRRPMRAGIGVFAIDGTALVATRGFPQLAPDQWQDPRGEGSAFITLAGQMTDGTPLVLFGAPIEAGEGAGDSVSGAIGWVVGARPLGDSFRAALDQPGIRLDSFETYVVAAESERAVLPLTPLAGGGRLMEQRRDPAASYIADQPGGFAELPNYNNEPVLVTGRELDAPVDWLLISAINVDEALADVEKSRNQLILILAAIGLFIAVVIYLVWRLGVSKRLTQAIQAQADLSARNESLSGFLASVANSQPAALAAVRGDLKVVFANLRMADVTGLVQDELEGRRLDTAFPSDISDKLKAGVRRAEQGNPISTQLKVPTGDGFSERVMRTAFVPLARGTDDGEQARALIVMEEITDLVEAQQRSEGLLNQLVGTLTQIIDARDPWSKFHSTRVADVAVAIARERDMSDIQIDTVRRAGQLVNLGKIFVPSEILTKEGQLSEDELALIRDSLQRGADLIKPLNFIGPVGETMAQLNARWDGKGEPEGLAGEAIEPCARVLSVANAFVGMVSARAHRSGIDFDAAIDMLQKDVNSRYERASVAALQNLLENKGGRARWASFGEVVIDDTDD